MTSPSPARPARIPAAGRYRVDPARSTVSFSTRHLFGLGGVTGTFRIREAELVVGDPVTATTVHAVLDAGSFHTGMPTRDTHVVSAQFLDADVFPDISVTGSAVFERDGRWVATGTVVAHGVAAPLELLLESVSEDDDGELVLRATTRIDRYAHGVTARKGMAGRRLTVTLDAVAAR